MEIYQDFLQRKLNIVILHNHAILRKLFQVTVEPMHDQNGNRSGTSFHNIMVHILKLFSNLKYDPSMNDWQKKRLCLLLHCYTLRVFNVAL